MSGEFKKPKAADYEGLDRSRRLREVCHSLIDIAEKASIRPEELSAQERLHLRTLPEELRQMGITPKMNVLLTGESKTKYQDPVYAAEYLAGELLNVLQQGQISEETALEALRTIRNIQPSRYEIATKGYDLLDTNNQPPETIRYNVNMAALNLLKKMFDL
ncbi:MAG: hypothetical protein AAB373_04445 [Patescibacteria group bacterium]